MAPTTSCDQVCGTYDRSTEAMAARAIAPLPGSDAIGQSYDVFGFYANPKSVKKELFNFSDQEEVELVDKTWLLSTDFKLLVVNGSSKNTLVERTKDYYSQKLAASVKVTGGFTFFESTIETEFSQSVTTQTDTSYSSIRVTVEKWKLSLKDDSTQTLQSKLKPEFRSALATMDPVKLFEAYGTHYLAEVLVGGRANYVSVTRTSAFESDTKLAVAAEASFSKVITGSSVSNEEEVKRFRENSSTSLYAVGGSALADIQDKEAYAAWLASVDMYPVFSGFTVDSLVPIWELAETESRREELKRATANFVPSYITRPALVDLALISGSEYVNPPYGFTKINLDLNLRAGGDYVFVCYKQARISVAGNETDPDPITALCLVVGEHPEVPSGYTKLDTDLNLNAGGKWLWLCYSRNTDHAEEGLPIRSICVIANGEDAPAPYGYTKLDTDLNLDAGGDYVYLCYSRHLDAP